MLSLKMLRVKKLMCQIVVVGGGKNSKRPYRLIKRKLKENDLANARFVVENSSEPDIVFGNNV